MITHKMIASLVRDYSGSVCVSTQVGMVSVDKQDLARMLEFAPPEQPCLVRVWYVGGELHLRTVTS